MKSSSITKVTNDGFMWLIVTDVVSTMFKNGYKGLLYKLYEDDSEALIESEEELITHLEQGGEIGLEIGFINGDPADDKKVVTTSVDWAESHYEIVSAIESECSIEGSKICKMVEANGMGSKWELAFELTNEFQEKHSNTIWGIDAEWLDTIDQFCKEKLTK